MNKRRRQALQLLAGGATLAHFPRVLAEEENAARYFFKANVQGLRASSDKNDAQDVAQPAPGATLWLETRHADHLVLASGRVSEWRGAEGRPSAIASSSDRRAEIGKHGEHPEVIFRDGGMLDVPTDLARGIEACTCIVAGRFAVDDSNASFMEISISGGPRTRVGFRNGNLPTRRRDLTNFSRPFQERTKPREGVFTYFRDFMNDQGGLRESGVRLAVDSYGQGEGTVSDTESQHAFIGAGYNRLSRAVAIQALLFYPRRLDEEEIQQTEDYLEHHYGHS